jgi:hypothetical protein
MTARIGNIAFDCDDVLKMAAFWSAVIGRSADKGSSEFLAFIGGTDTEHREPALYFNKVPESKRAVATAQVGMSFASLCGKIARCCNSWVSSSTARTR